MVLLFALGSFVTTLIGGLTALRIRDYRHLVFGFAAGLMLGVVALDLLPEAFTQQPGQLLGVPAPLASFVLGFLVLHVVERTVGIHRGHEEEYAPHEHAPTVGLLAASGLVGHSVMDGFAIGAAFQAGASVGIVVALAVISHDFADGFNTFSITTLYGNSSRRGLILLGADAIAPVLGASITLFFVIPHAVLGLYLGFFAGFLMYLATSDILPEAHASHPTRLTILFTVLGVAFIWLVVG
ncbi:MAG: ZIP family metal transporter, partial [Nocardioides sp.]